MIRHFGVFTFKDSVTQAEIDHCFASLKALVGPIPGLQSMEHGPYNGDEGLNDGFTHGFLMTFDSAASRDAYLPHPLHEEVREIVVPCLARYVVFDIEV